MLSEKKNPQRLHTIRFPLYNTLEVKKLEISVCQELGNEQWGRKG